MFFFQALKNCKELLDAGYLVSGSYRLNPTPELYVTNGELSPFRAYCDQESAGGGWAVVMRRFDGFVDFHRKWDAYIEGFGSLTGEFWGGLRKMRQLCGYIPVNMRFDSETEDEEKTFAEYGNCLDDDWRSKYQLTVGEFLGKSEEKCG